MDISPVDMLLLDSVQEYLHPERQRGSGAGDGLEDGIGAGKGGFEGIDIREEGSEVVDGEDEVLVVGAADLLDLGFAGASKGAEVVEEDFRVARGGGLANKRAQIIAVANRRGDMEEVLLVLRNWGRRRRRERFFEEGSGGCFSLM
ncbi:hypothetical protein MRB53_014157 [Persea americana]|uniref:Uncharacterized protein n=1 Tax=Persea americana TaxID=3435 RepID=A0ACC2KA87_PERAE|nr:hypothetical protein MRB53_014157 [Persea americana]